MEQLTFIGNGNMAFNIARGLKDIYKLEVVGRDIEKIKQFEEKLEKDIKKSSLNGFNIEGKTIILCVKPHNITKISTKITGKA